MLVVETIARIWREHFIKGKTIKEIARDLKVSRNTVRKVLRSGETSFEYERVVQPRPKLGGTPVGHVDVGEPLFPRCRQRRHGSRPLAREQRDRLDRAALDLLGSNRQQRALVVNSAGDQVLHCLPATAVRDVGNCDASRCGLFLQS